jgi:hypothetical protein
MDVAYLAALAALAGSVVGGFTTGLSIWTSQRAQTRTALLAHQISQREDLFRDFIIAASKCYARPSSATSRSFRSLSPLDARCVLGTDRCVRR